MEVRVYTSRAASVLSPATWREMVRELLAARELTLRLAWRDLRGRYRQAVLSFLWVIILPVAAVASFAFLKRSGLVRIGDQQVPYVVFGLTGLTIWQLFSGGVAAGAKALSGSGSLIAKINFPRETLVLAAMAQPLCDFAVRVVLTGIVLAVYGVVPAWPAALLAPLALVPLVCVTLAVGLLLGLLNALLHDIGYGIALVLMVALLLTPVLYPEPANPTFALVTRWNPLAALVGAPRDLLLYGTLPGAGFLALAAASVVALLAAWALFHLAEPRLTERFGAR